MNLDKATVQRMELPSVATRLWKKLVRSSRIPHPERYGRFAKQRFPSPLRIGAAKKPRLEIRYAGPNEGDGHVYEILVKDPDVRSLSISGERIELAQAPELPGQPRIGLFIQRGSPGGEVAVRGIAGIDSIDLSKARKEIDFYRARF